jgi:hypothetical protein
MNDIVQFSRNIRKRGRQVINSGSEAVRRAARKSLASLVQNTKVDTGKARSNWRVGIGGAPTAVIQAYSPYPKGSKAGGLGSSETANASAAIAAGNARINAVRGVSGVGLKTAVIITNNIDYLDKAVLPGALQIATREAQASLRGFRIFNPANGDDDGD